MAFPESPHSLVGFASMIFFHSFLFCLGLADLVAGGLSGEILSKRRNWVDAASLIGVLGALGLFVALGMKGGWALGFVFALGIGIRLWFFFRKDLGKSGKSHSALQAKLALGVLLVVGGLALFLDRNPLGFSIYFEREMDLPFLRLTRLLSSLVFLMGTSNGIVRAVLVAAGTSFQGEGQGFRGGRYIGVLERWMLLILAFSGNLTAAVIVVSAKSILRFPELTRAAEKGDPKKEQYSVDVLTEYFLLGSLASWFLPIVLVGIPLRF
jgi:hypothetical protein